ncbi:MAG TPA: undecaprenyl-phosphate alpha-N-acetylglucosaminyl 1-phosphate transferase [Elusimicrobia bacterium]|nr:MAG: hypothetical protein A2278_07470 [Elusimicrobia bacterium RIFOXYA12_FULL_49_49]OGS10323.1 MAG: hypothetical protein A2204_07340 [Elusimicrobia bacterium RIFOXYA1_FULL_47_7]OGS11102.1 MAG: hypothetical protein A2386_05760 [Elusimicrobia bacterium RIFOXYB1_FULL_48_9]OGS16095.1 MAG: hypothetical protein A2251_02795 [Elusimicrobia bacterium RIFOXYA2_FULL_47_53]OGS26721.1 MAG: hypothetical protein A2339_03845 [Elusimicrobia bacterium RIFOXYB12_FULL_50_12]OGS30153.1 MAG: hypothetical protein
MEFKSKPFRIISYVLMILVLAFLLQPSGGTWTWLHDVRWFYVLILSFILAYVITPIAIKAAWRLKLLDMPNERKIHSVPIPRVGGIAIVLAVIVATARNFQFSSELTGLVIGSSIIYLIGLIDDIKPLSASLRLAAQVIACVIVIKSGVVLNTLPLGFPGGHIIEIILTAFWLIGIANAINFLDGVDGLATGMVAISALLFFMIAWPTRQSYLAYLTIALAGASLGFLPYNYKPARIFLGDAGATFMGFLLAGLAVMGSWAYNNPMVAISTPLLILGIPIFDMIYTTISRVKNGSVRNVKEWLEYAGKDHFHHRLMKLGFSEKKTVIFIWGLNLCLGLGSLVIRDSGVKGSILLLVQSVIIFLMIVVLMLSGREIKV